MDHLAMPADQPHQVPVAADWEALGTSVRLLVTEPACLPEARAVLADRLAALDLACSRFRPDSEIVRLDDAAGRPVRVSPLLAANIGVALNAARATGGDLDPTVGASMAAIGYDRDFRRVEPDGPALRLSVRRPADWRQITFDAATRMLTVPEGVRLDLGATAKAWAADRAADHIAAVLGCGVLVNLGGDIAVAGEPPEGGWRVRVQDVTAHPDETPTGPFTVVAILGGGLATSSVTARRWRRGGDLLHHILDPRDGLPARTPWRTVSVAARNCLTANIASTAAIVRGAAAPRLLAARGLPARLVGVDGSVCGVAGWPDDTAEATPADHARGGTR